MGAVLIADNDRDCHFAVGRHASLGVGFIEEGIHAPGVASVSRPGLSLSASGTTTLRTTERAVHGASLRHPRYKTE